MVAFSAVTRIAFWVSTIQGLLVLAWTVYVLFLPPLAAQAGIPASWIIWILVADQAIFVASDWASGLFADRLAKWMGRIGPSMVIAALVSAGLFASMPFLARTGHPLPLLIAIALWAAVSSFLRAPAFSLLGKMGGAVGRPSVISWSLVGISCAGAMGPVITTSLRQLDPRWPLGVASLALAAAGLLASRIEPAPVSPRASEGAVAWPHVLLLSAITFVAAFGMQLHTSFGALHSLVAVAVAKVWWLPTFWIGFSVGLIGAARTSGSIHALKWSSAAIVVGAASLWLAAHVHETIPFAIAQGTAGAAWAVALTTVLAVMLRRSGAKGLASPLGVLMSAISLAAMSRLLCAALGLQQKADWTAWATAMWTLAAAGLLLHPWASTPARSVDADDPDPNSIEVPELTRAA
jgi:hypothetical protein